MIARREPTAVPSLVCAARRKAAKERHTSRPRMARTGERGRERGREEGKEGRREGDREGRREGRREGGRGLQQ